MKRLYLRHKRRADKKARARAGSRAKDFLQTQVAAVERPKMPTLAQMLAPCFVDGQFVNDPLVRGMIEGASQRSMR
jgi:hypothetical protein